MLQLETYDKKFHKEYSGKFRQSIEDRVDDSNLSPDSKDLLKSKIEILLTGSVDDITRENGVVMDALEANEGISKGDLKEIIKKIFDYDSDISRNKENSYWMAGKIGRNTCTYCNRVYSFTVVKGRGRNKRYITRPQFDHWYPKSKFPLLALSLYNLIPSCPVCNSTVKGQTELPHGEYIHPYIKDSNASEFKFRASLASSSSGLRWRLRIARKKNTKIDRTIRALALEEVYSQHAELEVKDIMDFDAAYERGYVNELMDNLLAKANGGRGLTRRDVYRMLFGVEYETDRFLDRPLSKLKRDLLEQIGLNWQE